jgi:hypothetical protein
VPRQMNSAKEHDNADENQSDGCKPRHRLPPFPQGDVIWTPVLTTVQPGRIPMAILRLASALPPAFGQFDR